MVQAYNSTRYAVTGYSPHYLMFRQWPKMPVDFYFLTVKGAERHKHVDKYITNLQDHLREACKEAQDQSMVEAQWQKWHYDRWINAISLEPGDLVLVNVDSYQGKRKIKDQWEDMPYEVECQVMNDVPSCIVKDKQSQSWILHHNWLLFINPEVERGIPLCTGVHTTRARCAHSTLDESTPEGSEIEELPSWTDCPAPTLHWASKTP